MLYLGVGLVPALTSEEKAQEERKLEHIHRLAWEYYHNLAYMYTLHGHPVDPPDPALAAFIKEDMQRDPAYYDTMLDDGQKRGERARARMEQERREKREKRKLKLKRRQLAMSTSGI